MRRLWNRPGARARADHTARPDAAANREAIAALKRYCEGDASGFLERYAMAAPRLFAFVRGLVRDARRTCESACAPAPRGTCAASCRVVTIAIARDRVVASRHHDC